MFCKYCGKELADTAKFCSKCGKQLRAEEPKRNDTTAFNSTVNANTAITVVQPVNQSRYIPTDSSKSRLVAALLAFFLGEFGAHRFYVGKTGSAIVQLVLGLSFFIALICAALDGIGLAAFFFVVGLAWLFWLLIDFIVILCGSFKDKDGLPLTDWGL